MDMRKFSGGIIKPEDLHDGPRREKIVAVSENERVRSAVLQTESGDQLYCWNNYARILSKASGCDSVFWIDQELETQARALPRQKNRHGKGDHRHRPDLAGQTGHIRRTG